MAEVSGSGNNDNAEYDSRCFRRRILARWRRDFREAIEISNASADSSVERPWMSLSTTASLGVGVGSKRGSGASRCRVGGT